MSDLQQSLFDTGTEAEPLCEATATEAFDAVEQEAHEPATSNDGSGNVRQFLPIPPLPDGDSAPLELIAERAYLVCRFGCEGARATGCMRRAEAGTAAHSLRHAGNGVGAQQHVRQICACCGRGVG